MKSIEVRVEMIDFVSRVKITQTYKYPRMIEVKPLQPHGRLDCGGVMMQVGDRVLVIQEPRDLEREEAGTNGIPADYQQLPDNQSSHQIQGVGHQRRSISYRESEWEHGQVVTVKQKTKQMEES